MSDDDMTVILASIVSAIGGLADAIMLVEAKGDMRPDERRNQLAEKIEAVQDELLEATVLIARNFNETTADSQPSR